jgi:hypothetical protein
MKVLKRDQCGYMIVSSRYDVKGGMQRGCSRTGWIAESRADSVVLYRDLSFLYTDSGDCMNLHSSA